MTLATCDIFDSLTFKLAYFCKTILPHNHLNWDLKLLPHQKGISGEKWRGCFTNSLQSKMKGMKAHFASGCAPKSAPSQQVSRIVTRAAGTSSSPPRADLPHSSVRKTASYCLAPSQSACHHFLHSPAERRAPHQHYILQWFKFLRSCSICFLNSGITGWLDLRINAASSVLTWHCNLWISLHSS